MINTRVFRTSLRLLLFCMLSAAIAVASGCCFRKKPYFAQPACPVKCNYNCPLCPERRPCSLCERNAYICYLHMHGVQVIRVGEDMRIIIPSDLLFKPYSANFKCDYLPVIDGMAQFMWCFDKVDVMVAGYTDCCGDPRRNMMLSELQAERVAKYIWPKNTDTRLIHTKGFGMKFPIARQSLSNFHGRARNRRIEITFRDIPGNRGIDRSALRRGQQSCD